jgi:hypothetical protein
MTKEEIQLIKTKIKEVTGLDEEALKKQVKAVADKVGSFFSLPDEKNSGINITGNLKEKHIVARKVNVVLNMELDPLGVLSWWMSPNSRLKGCVSPWEYLMSNEDIKTVRDLAEGITENSG